MKTTLDQTVENALIGFAKLLKSVSYYPDGHPSLNGAINQSLELFSQITSREQTALTLAVSRQGFSFKETLLLFKSPLPKTLAERLFFHKIKTVTILPDLIDRHLLTFARTLCSEPVAVTAQGGIHEILDQQRVSTIAVNELNLDSILNRKKTLEKNDGGDDINRHNTSAESNSSPEISPQEVSLNALLRRLDEILQTPSQKNEGPFLHGLRQLIQSLQQFLARGERHQTVHIIQHIDSWIQNPSAPKRYVTVLSQAVRSISGKPVIDVLIDNATDTKGQNLAQHIISHFNDSLPELLVNRLTEEIDHKLRKFLSQQLIDLGEQAFPALIESLEDERWFVVRNSVAILSENRCEKLIPAFVSHLNHGDGRVVNEAIRALARINAQESSQALISHLKSGVCDFPNQVILALGALGDPICTPELLRIANQRDMYLHEKATTKVAIMALSEIADPESAPSLIHLLQKVKFVKRKEYTEIRCQAALALGRFDDEKSLAVLKKYAKSSQRNLSSAARQALRLRNESQ
ncbi:MAG: hypothetical protein BA874_04810 [Desulfuromonadales bacterium C00003068]|jgi:hypothetical protein|nr:MAG: hypothetical protein BA874_04810 [Desulfuromonadales bacterium C00003068]